MAMKHPHGMSFIDELYSLATDERPAAQQRFRERMLAETPEAQAELWEQLAVRGITRRDLEAEEERSWRERERRYVVWTDEEWDRLASAVWTLRKNDPTAGLLDLARRVQGQWPEPRRRNLTSVQNLSPLVDRLTWLDERSQGTGKELKQVKQRCEELERQRDELQAQVEGLKTMPLLTPAPPPADKAQMLRGLTDEEVLRHFGRRVLSLTRPSELLHVFPAVEFLNALPFPELLAHAARKLGESLTGEREGWRTEAPVWLRNPLPEAPVSTPSPLTSPPVKEPTPRHDPFTQMPRGSNTALPRVTVVGLLPGQQRRIEEEFKDRARLTMVDKNREDTTAIPENQDVILLACNFIGHGIQELARKRAADHTRVVLHHGGMEQLAARLDRVLRGEL